MVMRVWTLGMVCAVSVWACADSAPTPTEPGQATAPALVDAALRAKVLKAIDGVWFHGITDEIARREVGLEGVPVLRELLADPGIARRDNVVAFLGHLGDAAAVSALIAHLESPVGDLTQPDEDRALLLVPNVLGLAAGRGDASALAFLLEVTAPGAERGRLALAAAKTPTPGATLEALLQSSLVGLERSRRPEALARLSAIADGKAVPLPSARDATRVVASELVTRLAVAAATDGGEGPSAPEANGEVAGSTSGLFKDLGVTWANHPAVSNPMTATALDTILGVASTRMQQADFAGDFECCTSLTRSGSALTFGAIGDGLDVIDTSTELTTVLSNRVAHVKVVRGINYCGGAGTNIIGCGYVGAKGLALVRMSTTSAEAVLWAHELGHNVGLNHNTTSQAFIMYGVNYSTNSGLTATECDTYHTGSVNIGMPSADLGSCLDTTCGDGVAEGDEACDGADLRGATCSALGCQGTPVCTSACTLDFSGCTQCVCDRDGVCEAGETCDNCPNDCARSSGATCGNGLCEAGNGEDCLSCPADCRGVQDGKPANRFCCGDGAGANPLSCSNATCTASGWRCTDVPAAASCCGDGACTGQESGLLCAIDCGPPPVCGDGVCNGNETACTCADCGAPPAEACGDGVDNDCDGQVDCGDADCASASVCLCLPSNTTCTSDAACCSGSCVRKGNKRACR